MFTPWCKRRSRPFRANGGCRSQLVATSLGKSQVSSPAPTDLRAWGFAVCLCFCAAACRELNKAIDSLGCTLREGKRLTGTLKHGVQILGNIPEQNCGVLVSSPSRAVDTSWICAHASASSQNTS